MCGWTVTIGSMTVIVLATWLLLRIVVRANVFCMDELHAVVDCSSSCHRCAMHGQYGVLDVCVSVAHVRSLDCGPYEM